MLQELNYKGEWWLPNNSQKQNGVLTYNIRDGANLEVVGSLGNRSPSTSTDMIILGKTADGFVTLFDCGYQGSQFNNETGVIVTNYRPSIILKGYLFENTEQIVFDSVKFDLFNLREWLAEDGYEESRNLNNYSAKYAKPADIYFKCYEGCTGKITYNLHVNHLNYPYSRKIDQNAEVEFIYESKTHFQKILRDIFVFVGFTTLGTYEQSYPLRIDFYSSEVFKTVGPRDHQHALFEAVECSYQNAFFKDSYKILKGRPLIPFQSIKDNFPAIISKWFFKSIQLEPVIKFLLSPFKNKFVFETENFMDVIRALEVFHRHNFSNEVIPKEEFNKKWNSFIDSTTLNDLDKAWLKQKIHYGNEPTLIERLRELVSIYSFPYFNKRVPDIEKFCKEARDSRNYLTHFDPSLKKKCLQYKALFDLSENLKLLLFSCVFKEIGISADQFENGLRANIYS